MGYRLNIDKIIENKNCDLIAKTIFYGTKLYGYTDESKLKSYLYLISIGKMSTDEYFDYGSNQRICLNKKEFTIFCYLYNIDYNQNKYLNEQVNDVFINSKEISNELMFDSNVYDNEIYIISWS